MAMRFVMQELWADPYFNAATAEQKVIYLWLSTGPLTNGIGLRKVSSEVISLSLRLNSEVVESALDYLVRVKLIEREKENELIFVVDYLRTNKYHKLAANHPKSITSVFAEYKHSSLAQEVYRKVKADAGKHLRKELPSFEEEYEEYSS